MGESISKSRPETVRTGAWSRTWSGFNTPVFTDTRSNVVKTQTFSGTKNPKYIEQMRRVANAGTSASGSISRVYGSPFTGSCSWWLSAGQIGNPATKQNRQCLYLLLSETSLTTNIPPPGVPTESTADNRAIARLYERIMGFESAAMAGEDLGELKQTIGMLRAPMKPLRNAIHGYYDNLAQAMTTRGRVQTKVRALASSVLEFNFGLMPLVNTTTDAVMRLQNPHYMAHYYPFSAQGEHTTSRTGQGGQSAGHGTVEFLVEHVRTSSVRYKGVWGVSAGTDKASVNDILRLRFRDVVPTIWNLIPGSWLADYCTNVGTIAEQFAVDWSGVRWCMKTVRTINDRKYTPLGYNQPQPHGFSESISHGSHAWKTITFYRIKHNGMPRPHLEIDLDLSPKRMLNVAAFIAQKIPILGKLAKKAVDKNPTLPHAFRDEMYRRRERIPYPFHK